MRIAVYGPGAIGGLIAHKLATSGNDVSVIARGATLDAIRTKGLTLEAGPNRTTVRVQAAEKSEELGTQDLVISTVKATAPAALAAGLAPLLGAETPIVFAQNGIPWWYGHRMPAGRATPPDLGMLDPGGGLAALGVGRVLGAVIHIQSEVPEPGVVHDDNPASHTLLVGEIDDSQSPRVAAIRSMLEAAGIKAPVVPDIRQAVWRKLLVNTSASVLCLITGKRLTIARDDPAIGELFLRAARDVMAVARAHGIDLAPFDPANWRKSPPDHLPSIRQDYDRNRPMEIDAIVRAPQAFARAAGLDTPSADAVWAIATFMAVERGLAGPG